MAIWRKSNHFMSIVAEKAVYRCDFCNTEFETSPHKKKKNKNIFCSANCFQEWKRINTPNGKDSQYYNRIETKCDYCGNVLHRTPWKIENRNNQFCNKECNNNWLRLNARRGSENPQYSTIEKPCSYCGKALKRQPWQANGYEHTFCNKTCHGKWQSENLIGENNPLWQGGHTEYRGSNWHIQRHLARERDNNTCQHCGVTRDQIGRELDVHHIIPFRHFDDYRIANALPNLITLCGSCHMKAEPRKGTI
jgi:5-methylcytosine-specific restriction endonuclease McrA